MAARSRRIALAVALMVFASLSAGGAGAFEPVTFYGFDKESLSPEAQAGMEEIFAGRCFHSGVPVAGARMMLNALRQQKDKLGYDPGTTAGRFYAQGRFVSPPERTAGSGEGFGLGESVFERDGKQLVNGNCFSCHAGVVHGQVVAGLGNIHVNQSRPQMARTRGDNFGPYAVWRLSARMSDPANQGMVLAKEKTELEALLDAEPLPPVDPMPWWLMKYKKLDYWYADAGIHDAASFAVNFTTPHDAINEHRAEHVETVAKALAFARETQSPIYPGTLDAELVQRGSDLFHGRVRPAVAKGFRACRTCHGAYTKKHPDDDLSRPGGWKVNYKFSHVLRNVRTDPTYNTTLQRLAPIAEHINKLEAYFHAQGTPELVPTASVPTKPGYVAPPLVGVWASAPYFHNGSVPTVEAVLNSKLRPEIWSRSARDPYAYDLVKVGIAFEELSRAEYEQSAAAAQGSPFLSQASIDHGAIYDTKGFGHGNMGHPFGDSLSDTERAAVIEFLKSLSGPDM